MSSDLNSHLLGMVVIAKLYSAAMRRIVIERADRRDFFLYVDEFQNLATESFAGILSEARKFRLNLTLANQYIAQLPSGIINAVLGNVGTLAVFRVGVADAEVLENSFAPSVRSETLAGQPNYHAYIRLMVNGELTVPFSLHTELEPDRENAAARRQEIVERTRAMYGRPKVQVEDEISRYLLQK